MVQPLQTQGRARRGPPRHSQGHRSVPVLLACASESGAAGACVRRHVLHDHPARMNPRASRVNRWIKVPPLWSFSHTRKKVHPR